MIASGEKKEEYREIKPYWAKRFYQEYDAIQFVNGYGLDRPRMLIKFKYLEKGFGVPSWGAPTDKEVYILGLGKILVIDNYNIKKPE